MAWIGKNSMYKVESIGTYIGRKTATWYGQGVVVRKRAPLFFFNTLFKLRFTNYSECTVWTRLQCERLTTFSKCVRVEVFRYLLISCTSRLLFKMSAETPVSVRRPEKKTDKKTSDNSLKAPEKRYVQLNLNSAPTSIKNTVVSEKQPQKSNDRVVQT